jgi:hypothetical protein
VLSYCEPAKKENVHFDENAFLSTTGNYKKKIENREFLA